jgi:hypothetical protein
MKRSALVRKTPMARTGFFRTMLKPSLAAKVGKTLKTHKSLRTTQRPVSAAEKALHDRMAKEIGCIACFLDGVFTDYVSIHHIDGRTKPNCHKEVLALCAGHHQDGTGNDKSMIAVHPYKARFEARYGRQYDLLALVMNKLGVAE